MKTLILGGLLLAAVVASLYLGYAHHRETIVTVRNSGHQAVQFSIVLMGESTPAGRINYEWPKHTLQSGESIDTSVGTPTDSNVGIRLISSGRSARLCRIDAYVSWSIVSQSIVIDVFGAEVRAARASPRSREDYREIRWADEAN